MLKKVTHRDILGFCWHYWSKRPRVGVVMLSLMIAATVVDAFVPIYTGKIVDSLVQYDPGDPEGLWSALWYLSIFVSLAAAYHVLRTSSVALWAWFAVQCMYELLTDALRKVQRFSADWHANTFAGGTVRKVTRGMWSFDVFEDTLFLGLFPALIIMIGMTTMLIVKLPLVGLFAALMIVIYCAVSIWFALSLAPYFQSSAEADTKVGAILADIITGNPTVKAFGAEAREARVFDRVATLWRLRAQKAWITGEFCNMIRGVLRMCLLAGMVGLTIWLWKTGDASPGDIALSLTGFFLLGGYLRDIGMHIANLQRSMSEMEDVVTFWLEEEEVKDVPYASPLVVTDGAIEFQDVSFSYSSEERRLFRNLSIQISPGEKVALVGRSGSGKSSFVKLIQRLYDVDGGVVRIDGQDISQVSQESLRQAIALVPQEPILFHRSLSSNIAYSRPNATHEEIVEATREAYAYDFIQQLPDGFGTLVGERGVKLSGGERQRVAIARAILADTKILILDEATSSLDSESEHYIQRALDRLMEGRTTVTIAHRLSTIQGADRILVFEAGEIVEEGTHEELLHRPGSHYGRLYRMQELDMVS